MSEHLWPIRVYYEDTDASGVAYHANYLRWFERARTEWLRALGYSQERLRNELGIAFTVASIEIAYRKPARLDDELRVVTRVAERRRASMRFDQELWLEGGTSRLLSTASVRVGCVDEKTFKPCAMPEALWPE